MASPLPSRMMAGSPLSRMMAGWLTASELGAAKAWSGWRRCREVCGSGGGALCLGDCVGCIGLLPRARVSACTRLEYHAPPEHDARLEYHPRLEHHTRLEYHPRLEFAGSEKTE